MFQRGSAIESDQRTAETTFLDEGTSLCGSLTLGGPARIQGQVEGEITARDTLTIGESGVVKARIAGTTVIVRGQVTGDITASTRLELHSASRVHGNISAPTLVIHEGAVFMGQCTMGEGARAARTGRDAELAPLAAVAS
jgi:cytoskeletal protein CcmA (bactofilin family)